LKSKIYNNKKGIGIDDALPIIIFIFIAALVIGFLKINDKVKSDRTIENIQRQKDILEGHQTLMEYLNKLDEQDSNKEDFISKSIMAKDYDAIKQDVTQYFNGKLGNLGWYLEIRDSTENLVMPVITNAQFSQQEQYSSTQSAFSVSSVLIPINEQVPTYITIELFFLSK